MGKLIRAVLRGRNGGNTVLLPDKYEQEGVPRKLYGFTAILCYSRMRFVTFVKRCDTPTMIWCLMEAFEYFGGLPKAALTDRMKSVLLLEMEGKVPRWNPLFADFMASIGVAPRVCKVYTPQTNAKAESFFKTVKREEVYVKQYDTFQEAEGNLRQFIEDVYNTKRLHSSLGYLPPTEFEEAYSSARESSL